MKWPDSLQNPATALKRTGPIRPEAEGRMLNLTAPAPNSDDLITKKELAKRLHKTPRCIELWMRRRYLPYIKLGRSVLFNWPDVVKALERFRIGDKIGE
jgi:hypothetical protein